VSATAISVRFVRTAAQALHARVERAQEFLAEPKSGVFVTSVRFRGVQMRLRREDQISGHPERGPGV